jgi:hypothetical protein
MPKTSNLLLVLNLLHYRHRVTIENIMCTCGVSSRTAYRYITALSEANIPVLFDKNIGGYRLNVFSKVTADHVTELDGILIKVALLLLESATDKTYAKAIESLMKKLDSVLPMPHENLFAGIGPIIAENLKTGQIARVIHSLLLETAVHQDKSVRLRLASGTDTSDGTTIEHPSLHFKGEWQVSSRDPDCERTVAVSDVEEVRLIEKRKKS